MLTATICLTGTPSVTPAYGQNVAINRDGAQINRSSCHHIDHREAIYIAMRNGVIRVFNAERRGRYWIVTGQARRARGTLSVRINACSGGVIEVDRRGR
jgi:hypothetical protein